MRLACASHAEGVPETAGRSDFTGNCGDALDVSVSIIPFEARQRFNYV
jgi:hypothetical protein